jgi:hypothetical protein
MVVPVARHRSRLRLVGLEALVATVGRRVSASCQVALAVTVAPRLGPLVQQVVPGVLAVQ